MFRPQQKVFILKLTNVLMLSGLLFLYACLPTSTPPQVNSNNSTEETGGSSGGGSNYQEPTYPLEGTFIQEGAVRSNSAITIPTDFTDSFLIRGKVLSQYLRTIPITTKFCMVGKFNYQSGADRYLILAARPKTYTDLINKSTEFYLQVEPSNEAANKNDCLSFNLTNSLYNETVPPSVPSAHFSFFELCTNCTSAVTSSGLRLFFVNGQEVPVVPLSSLILTIAGSSTPTNNGCFESTSCKARGFDCCLNTQCVKDGSVKPGANLLPGFLAAEEDVRLNPNRFLVYPQFYFVCESRPGTTTGGASGGGTGGSTPQDPNYEAAVRIMELKQLYDCMNKVHGEFSLCTLKFTQANESMPGTFSAAASGHMDDINFSSVNQTLGTSDYVNNIYKITYTGQTLYEQNKTALTVGTFSNNNDNLTSAQSVYLNAPLPANAQDANLYITYKVDGTCEKVGATLTKCTKSYIQASSDQTSSLWHDNTKTYRLPVYADVTASSNIIVKVSGVVVPEDSWSKSGSLGVTYSGQSPKGIILSGSYPVFQNQTIEISYFITTNAADVIKLKTLAQERVNSICTCSSGSKCSLKPIIDETTSAVTNYECSYSSTAPSEPPVNQTVYVSNKNIAHRYYDLNGVNYDEDYGGAPKQEGSEFLYSSNNILKPNNVTESKGFNEIYGSFTKSGTYIAKPAKLVKVKKDKFYDILVNSGVFSSCLTCGTDYYSALQKIFPQNFSGGGGGYAPDNYETRRENNTSLYRADDLHFGRACFVPATMIPWTHITSSTPKAQRDARLAAQHFLFANGYNRDWYGFDYGSLIGSFDGVSWFSIGNQRRIKASSGKLFLAVNAYLGDLNVDSNFNVTVSETTAFSSAIPDHDTETDGAQCQKSHYCSQDNDCIRQLGYDYTCQNVSTINTNWPLFDQSASEIVGSNLRSLVSIVGGSNGQAKRCIYRGRGAPCLANLNTAATSPTFNGSSSIGSLMCSSNNSCLSLTMTNRFNDRISRFANTPTAQNAAAAAPVESDTVGLGARIILRPFEYYGTKSIPGPAKAALNSHNVNAICVPGKDIAPALNTLDLHSRHPGLRTDTSDKVFGVGPTMSSVMAKRSLNACPATDAAGNNMKFFGSQMDDDILTRFAVTQNMSSNLLDLNFLPLKNQNIFSSTGGTKITSIGYQRNTCLRAPGASCFTDMECAPSSFIAAKTKAVNLASILNEAEAKFWGEELVCGNPDFKYVSAGVKNPSFDVKKNVCCREYGKTHTVYTQMSFTSPHQWCDAAGNIQVAGINTNISSPTRYSRVHSAYDKMTCNLSELPGKPFALSLASDTPANRMQQILGQYKTLDTVNERTCCTKNWVRSFATENGGGHAFSKTKMQNIDKAMWRNISWMPDDEVTIVPATNDAAFECHPDQTFFASCEIKSLLPSEQEKYLKWAGSLELVGIPQVAIQSNDQVYKLVNDSQGPIIVGVPLTDSDDKNVISDVAVVGADFSDTNGSYYSAASYSKLNMDSASKNSMKKVFSENEFNCCVPSGQEVPDTTTAGQCCTGFVANLGGLRRCCLPDFTDITVYMNRYVSSEGRGLPDSAYDQQTGYIKDPGQVKLMAAQKNLCCSGNAMMGVAINKLSIPLTGGTYKEDLTTTSIRFNYRSDAVDNNNITGSVGSIFDAGVRWNNHVYCVPAGLGN